MKGQLSYRPSIAMSACLPTLGCCFFFTPKTNHSVCACKSKSNHSQRPHFQHAIASNSISTRALSIPLTLLFLLLPHSSVMSMNLGVFASLFLCSVLEIHSGFPCQQINNCSTKTGFMFGNLLSLSLSLSFSYTHTYTLFSLLAALFFHRSTGLSHKLKCHPSHTHKKVREIKTQI